MNTYAFSHRRTKNPKAGIFTSQVNAENFQKVVELLEAISSDDGGEIISIALIEKNVK